MLIKDIALLIPRSFISTILKTVRTDIDKVGKEQILKNGLYHITPNEEIAKQIIDSGYLKPATGLMKNINSYGTSVTCMFDGIPTMDNYMKNLDTAKSCNNPLLTPNLVLNAVKFFPTEMSELSNYKARSLVDNVILYEGYCMLPKEKVQIVKLVPDLKRDSSTNTPIVNSKTGEYEIIFREAEEGELNQNQNTYQAKEDYLKYVENVKKEIGYIEGHTVSNNVINALITVMQQGKIEGDMVKENGFKNIFKSIKDRIDRWKTPKLDMTTDEKIYKELEEYQHKKKNPYRDKKFAMAVANFRKQGLEQLPLKNELEKVTTGEVGKYIRRKYKQIDKTDYIKRGSHNIQHNNRVAMLSMIIAKNEGILESDKDNRIKDILLTAAYEHDTGRRIGKLTFHIGSHAKRSVRKLKKKNLRYADGQVYSEEDKNILKAVIEAHECKDETIDKLCQKYHISEQNKGYTKKLMTILKDADALDRVRLDFNLGIMITELDPKYLRTNTAKRLLNASYQLEGLTNKISFDKILTYKVEEQTKQTPELYRKSLKSMPVKNMVNSFEQKEGIQSKEQQEPKEGMSSQKQQEQR